MMDARLSPELIVAARLADPAARGRIDLGGEIDWASVLAILVENRVPLIGLADDPALAACPLARSPEFQRAAAGQRERWRSHRGHYGAARERFLERGIASVLFKSAGLAPSFPFMSDNLDTLVRPEHIPAGREILGELGFVELRNVEEPLKLLFRKFEGGESVSAIHLHGTVGWGVPFLDDAALWGRVRASADDPLALVPAPEDALLVTIAHAFYEDKSFKLLDVARIRRCLHERNVDFAEVERIARARGWEDGLAFCLLLFDRFEDWLYGERTIPHDVSERARRIVASNALLTRWFESTVKRDDIRFPFRLSFFLGKVVYYRKVTHDPRRSRATRMADVARTLVWGIKLKLRIRGQRGMIVSLSGIDGSGKTARVRALERAFATADTLTNTYWSRFGSSARTSGLGRRGAGAVKISDTATALARRRRRLAHPAVRFGWLAYNLAQIVLRYNALVRVRRMFGRVVICDRYLYDAAVEIGASLPDNPGLSRWAERVLTSLCPRPAVAWLFDVPAELSVERQADENRSAASREELSKQRSAYLALARTRGLRVVTTDGAPEAITDRVVRETLVAYYDGYRTWVNALLLSNPDQMNPPGRAR
jgi:thymidylate kinase